MIFEQKNKINIRLVNNRGRRKRCTDWVGGWNAKKNYNEGKEKGKKQNFGLKS